ncbi:hypothetical protein Ctob_005049 [Chrysochromulina tobinii]|uniref:Uncharacterized protein n=1 Tax=Chrysochromulina tobinii TaxID=1460289 RepID=A0A0M0JRS1_9EUKA|nr:hypothetical protein Ctob_005049 [Chrysochromulina tobinii]|eukprot:KOO29306.1 hypothetical protein Ctob_005049 [Chrysochromulina sp. CCMP291]
MESHAPAHLTRTAIQESKASPKHSVTPT